MEKTKKVMIIAGEASGDMHGSNLAKEIKQRIPDIKLIGIGGKNMQQAGVELLADITHLAVCGFFEVIRYLPQFFLLFYSIKKAILEQKPDLVLLIDFPGFNLRIAKIAHQYKINVLYYISPQLWAWHTSRIKKIKRYVTMMAVIFPFEVDFYRHHTVPVKYVGHPLIEVFAKLPPSSTFRVPQKIIIGLLPGSRKNEIKYILPTLIATAQLIQQQLPDIEFVLPLASTITEEEIECQLAHTSLPIKIITAHRYDAMRQCHVVIAASGTVTLELALLGTPLVIVYKGNPLSFILAKRLVKIPHVGLCNIIAGKKIAEELLQNEATPERIWREVKRLIEDKDYREEQKAALTNVAQRLSLERECSIAQLVCDVLN
jgi:lipid-A-disaccharide synthase